MRPSKHMTGIQAQRRPDQEQKTLCRWPLAFALLDQKPTQDTSIDIHALLLKEAEQRLPVLIEQKLRRPLG